MLSEVIHSDLHLTAIAIWYIHRPPTTIWFDSFLHVDEQEKPKGKSGSRSSSGGYVPMANGNLFSGLANACHIGEAESGQMPSATYLAGNDQPIDPGIQLQPLESRQYIETVHPSSISIIPSPWYWMQGQEKILPVPRVPFRSDDSTWKTIDYGSEHWYQE